ncbi:hypothetical protein G7046_g2354 [Stylonectria norvegica]|nr:hypothetical protein G7046_g2354 [Stylonectria norvegica]
MRTLVFSGLLGKCTNRLLVWDMVTHDSDTTLYIATLISTTAPDDVEKHLIRLRNIDGSLMSTMPAKLTAREFTQLTQNSSLGSILEFSQIEQGGYAVTYKFRTGDCHTESREYVAQLRYHGNVESMTNLLSYLRQYHLERVPVPQVFPTDFRPDCGLGLQISHFVPGKMGHLCFASFPRETKSELIKQIARAYGALWSLNIPRPRNLIGEVIVHSTPLSLSVGPDRQYKLGGPFSTVTSFLRAWILNRFDIIEGRLNASESKQNELDVKKHLVQEKLANSPHEVEEVPIVITHSDMSLHNMIFSFAAPTKLEAIIDWEFVHSMPFAVLIPTSIDPLFVVGDDSVSGGSFVDEDLRNAFWAAIPEWRGLTDLTATKIFLEYYQFGLNL